MKNQKVDATKNPFILMPILLLMWGSLAATSKLLLKNLDSYQVLFYMYGIAVLVYAVILIVKVKPRELLTWTSKDFVLLILCGVFAFLYDFLYIKALERLPAIEASMLNYLFPIFIVLFAIPINRERLDVYKVISIGLGFAGTVLLITKGKFTNISFTNVEGDLMAIFAAVCWGLFTNLAKKNSKDIVISNIFITFVASILSICSLFTFSQFKVPTIADFSGFLWLSISNIILGFLIYIRALKYSSASLVASFTYFTPCVTVLFIILMVGERLTIVDFIAFLLICISVPIQRIGKVGVMFSRKQI
ncbi:EamA domain-containing membrane protein RarD [Aneurinibacillus soli]|uniref:Aromatic amino acid exporter n=1 Tax=Aneurinibacillus soli TaxID=1500254 RepID=A0A0U4WAW2_9BACL|nr:DMT family transporter [Aneurinibacillus soli]PYE58959.1 EamA domain-containing membrane protein RarD [Aneurinibacillus soli]BAU26025.1 aromatic amino acid exporter [Aneurinibacillus soli]